VVQAIRNEQSRAALATQPQDIAAVSSFDPTRAYMSGLVRNLPPFPTREDLAAIFPVKQAQRLMAAGWLMRVDMGSRETHFSFASVIDSIDRINTGEQPPRLLSEPVPKGTRRVPSQRRSREE
jgi:hypothetical protein